MPSSRFFSRKFPSLTLMAVSLCLARSLGAEADPTPSPSLAAIVETALRNNRDLDAFRLRVEAADERTRQARSLQNPRVGADIMSNRHGSLQQTFALSQQLPWFGTLREAGNAASSEADTLLAAVEVAELALIDEVGVTYHELAYASISIALTKETLVLLENLLPVVEARVSGGGDLNELLRLQVEVTRLRDRIETLEVERAVFTARLRALINSDAYDLRSVSLDPVPPLVETEIARWTRSLSEWNPELGVIRAQIESAEARRRLARLGRYPDFTVGISYSRADEGMRMMGSEDPWAVSFSINLPIWGTRNRAGVREEAALRDAFEAELENRETELRAELSTNVSRLHDSHRRLALYGSELLDLAEQASEISRTSYEGGRATLLEVIDSERTLIDLRLDYWRATADAWQHRIKIQTLINQPLFLSRSPSAS